MQRHQVPLSPGQAYTLQQDRLVCHGVLESEVVRCTAAARGARAISAGVHFLGGVSIAWVCCGSVLFRV